MSGEFPAEAKVHAPAMDAQGRGGGGGGGTGGTGGEGGRGEGRGAGPEGAEMPGVLFLCSLQCKPLPSPPSPLPIPPPL